MSTGWRSERCNERFARSQTRLAIVGATGMVGGYEPNFSCRVSRTIYPASGMLFPNQVIDRADDPARDMVEILVLRIAVKAAGYGGVHA